MTISSDPDLAEVTPSQDAQQSTTVSTALALLSPNQASGEIHETRAPQTPNAASGEIQGFSAPSVQLTQIGQVHRAKHPARMTPE